VLAAGCTDDAPDSAARQRSAGERLRALAVRDSRELGARYDAVIAAHPALRPRLEPLRTEVGQHAQAFGAAGGGASAAPSKAAAGSTPGTRPGTGGAPDASVSGGPQVPVSETDALAMLASAERTLADRRTTQLLDVPGDLARLLASVAAAGAAHGYLLTEGNR
jgi:hypothetical protein